MKILIPLILTFAYAVIFWIVFAIKCYVEGFGEVMRYFTNWTFFITGVYFTVEFFTYFTPLRVQQMLRFLFWWMVFGQNVIVFCLVFIMMLSNSSIVEKLTEKNGGDFTLGEVLDLEKLFHVIPTVFLFYLCIINRNDIKESMMMVRESINKGAYALTAFMVLFHTFSGSFMAILFQVVFGFNETYNTSIPVGLGVLAVICIIAIFVCPAYYELLPSKRFVPKHIERFKVWYKRRKERVQDYSKNRYSA